MCADGVHVLEGSEERIRPLRYRTDIKEKELAESLRKAEATKARTVVKPARNRPMRSIMMVVVAKEQESKKQEPEKRLGGTVAAGEDELTELLNNAAQEDCCFEEAFPSLST